MSSNDTGGKDGSRQDSRANLKDPSSASTSVISSPRTGETTSDEARGDSDTPDIAEESTTVPIEPDEVWLMLSFSICVWVASSRPVLRNAVIAGIVAVGTSARSWWQCGRIPLPLFDSCILSLFRCPIFMHKAPTLYYSSYLSSRQLLPESSDSYTVVDMCCRRTLVVRGATIL